jgi:hypothetical protein
MKKLTRIAGVVNLKDWTLDAFTAIDAACSAAKDEIGPEAKLDALIDGVKRLCVVAAAEALEVALSSDDDAPYIHTPITGDYPEGDPLAVGIHIGVGDADTLDDPAFQFTLRDVYGGDMQDCAIDGSYGPELQKVATALRDLASEIEAAIATGYAKKP